MAIVALAGQPTGVAAAQPVSVTNYTDPTQALAWGQKSHWKQPWRSYLDTVPAITLLNAIGINFNVKAAWAESTAKLLGSSGFRRARIEVPWGTIDYDDPSRMTDSARSDLEKTLTALRENGIRPLVLLNGNHGKPCPVKFDTIQLTAPAEAGDTVIHVDPGELAKIVPGRTGIRSGGVAAQYLFTSAGSDGTVELSAPLGSISPATAGNNPVSSLPAGSLDIETLRYEPFHSARNPDGSPNPGFESTVHGWLDYVGVITREVKSILGSEDFDVEIWNEMSFGSRFLEINSYYDPNLEGSNAGSTAEILARTVGYIRDPSNGAPDIGVGDGFASQTPWPSAANTPIGLTAIDKHPYPKVRAYPRDAYIGGNRPLNGLGEPAGREVRHGEWQEVFVPTYYAFFPEYTLSGIQTETLIHDLAPISSSVGGIEHGRFAHAPGGSPAEEWITELNLDPTTAPLPVGSVSQADVRHIETKDTLRSLVAFVNKGVTALDFYAVKDGNFSLVEPSFFSTLKGSHPTYPGAAAGGETTEAVGRLAQSLQGSRAIVAPRSLSLRELTDPSGNVQFEGNGTAAYPSLYNRDVFAFFPFQVTPSRFVVPIYVMTRNVAKVYDPDAPSTDPARFDMPEEPYRLDIGGVNGKNVEVSAADPATGKSVPVRVLGGSDHHLAIETQVTDSPRLLTIQEEAPAGGDQAEKSPAHGSDHAPGQTGARPGPPTFELRHRPTLLKKRRLLVLARYRAPYTLGVQADLLIGGRPLPLQPKPNVTRVERSGPAAVVLTLSATRAKLARLALRRGAAVKLEVTVNAQSESGNEQSTRRAFVIGS